MATNSIITSGRDRAASLIARLRRADRGLVYAIGLLPAVWTFALALTDQLGADPAKTLERTMGLWALRFIVLGLAISPLRRWGWNLIRYRRASGLLAFYYALLHVVAYAWFDYGFDWGMIWGDIVKRPYITIGLAAFLILVPLAITSTNGMIKRMGAAAWQRLHKLVYVAAVGAILHFLMLVKVITTEPFVYAALVTLLLAVRLVPKGRGWDRRVVEDRVVGEKQQVAGRAAA